MTSFSNTQNSIQPSSDSVLLAAQIAAVQNLDQNQQENNRTQKHEHHSYVTKRAREHARTEENAKNEAINKSKKVANVRHTQTVKNDSMNSAGQEIGNSLTTPKSTKHRELQKPRMPAPTTPFGSGETKDDDINVMAIIARVLVLVTNTQIKGWSTFWNMGAQNINTSWTMSQAEAQNTQQQYQMQANATKTQAEQYGKDGMMELGTFGVMMIAGATMSLEESPEELKKPSSDPTQLASETRAPNADALEASQVEDLLEDAAPTNGADGAPAAQDPNDAAAQDADRVQNAQDRRAQAAAAARGDTPIGDTLDAIKEKGKNSGALNFISKVLKNGAQYGLPLQQGMQGSQHFFIDKPLLSTKSGYEGAQGIYAAAATLARGYSEYNNQVFNRNEDIRQQTSQGVDYAMNIYKSASDALTQAVSTMAR